MKKGALTSMIDTNPPKPVIIRTPIALLAYPAPLQISLIGAISRLFIKLWQTIVSKKVPAVIAIKQAIRRPFWDSKSVTRVVMLMSPIPLNKNTKRK